MLRNIRWSPAYNTYKSLISMYLDVPILTKLRAVENRSFRNDASCSNSTDNWKSIDSLPKHAQHAKFHLMKAAHKPTSRDVIWASS